MGCSCLYTGLDLFITTLTEIHDKIYNENKIAYIMGDYNINLLNVDSHLKTGALKNGVTAQ